MQSVDSKLWFGNIGLTPKTEDAGGEVAARSVCVYGEGREQDSKVERMIDPDKGYWDLLSIFKADLHCLSLLSS